MKEAQSGTDALSGEDGRWRMEDGTSYERTTRSVLECGGPPPLFQPQNPDRTDRKDRKERKECKAGTEYFVFSAFSAVKTG
jgi:hypothetical protein